MPMSADVHSAGTWCWFVPLAKWFSKLKERTRVSALVICADNAKVRKSCQKYLYLILIRSYEHVIGLFVGEML